MPTFRDTETGFFDVMDLDSFNAFLKGNQILFCVKLHPKSRIKQYLSKLLYDNIIVIDSLYDPYPFLKMADRLVTDYSSIYFDFLLTDRPVIFFHYDLEQYLEGSRDMYFDYNDFTPGEKVTNQNSLEKALLAEDTYREFRESIRNKVFDDIGQCASEQLYYRIKGELNHHE
jgi:CDP-glycerol glycerophosphotransferase